MQDGLYESLWTTKLARAVGADPALVTEDSVVDAADESGVLARHLTPVIEQVLRSASAGQARAEIVRRVLGALNDDEALTEGPVEDPTQTSIRQLLSVSRLTSAGQSAPVPVRPATPLAEAALLTNARNEPTLAAELRNELASADEVDLLCAFVKWQGVRLLEGQLRALRDRGIPVRVITTTYLGATDARALDALVNEFGAEVRVNYEIDRTRLHAKAWLFRRSTGFDTAYIGSSNLSHSALVEGLEWNVRLSAIGTPVLLNKFRTTFDSYWESREFEAYSPEEDGTRIREALDIASGKSDSNRITVTLSGLDVTPKPHQAEMLEELAAERELHDRHRNLIVAATGTGKTVIAALDYRRLVESTYGRDLRLLFVAHRMEILQQARRTYREVLNEPSFGEMLGSSQEPKHWKHVFATVQSLSEKRLSALAPDAFDVIVVDEFHHAEAASYKRLLNKFEPLELLGLTATPERGDGVDVRSFFDGRVASELRLWDALDQNLLCPFHYFGIYDGTNLSSLSWSKGSYDATELSNLYTGNDARARVVLKELRDKVVDLGRMRAIGFCVRIAHANFMAEQFVAAGIPARAVSGETPPAERDAALQALRAREINVLFAVDLFNEGLDIPEVDTVLFLRPTESATVFLQQLGRGLRMTRNKTVLTALDFVGHQRTEFRFDNRFRAMTGASRGDLPRQIEAGFPFLPSGSQIVLDEVATAIVLDNVKRQVAPRKSALVADLRAYDGTDLAGFLIDSGRSLPDILRTDRSFTTLCREADKPLVAAGPNEERLCRRVRAFGHVDDSSRAQSYTALLTGRGERSGAANDQLASMLFFSLFPDGGGFADVKSGLAVLAQEPAVVDELSQVIDLAFDQARRVTYDLAGLEPGLEGVPLATHGSYSREEILAALGHASLERKPSTMREGVAWCAATNADALFITLKKSEAQFSPTTMYRDFALSQELFHWESQSTTRSASPTGQRYIEHRARGSHVLLFVRETQAGPLGTSPYIFLGPADYVSHTGDRPMAITWHLRTPMPTELYLAARAAVA